MPPAARMTDKVLQDAPHCHAPIHPPAPTPTPVPHPAMPLTIIPPCAVTVMIGGKPAARVTDMTVPCMLASCVPGGPGIILEGLGDGADHEAAGGPDRRSHHPPGLRRADPLADRQDPSARRADGDDRRLSHAPRSFRGAGPALPEVPAWRRPDLADRPCRKGRDARRPALAWCPALLEPGLLAGVSGHRRGPGDDRRSAGDAQGNGNPSPGPRRPAGGAGKPDRRRARAQAGAYDVSRQHLSIYAGDHYADWTEPPETSSMAATMTTALAAAPAAPAGPALDIGSGPGRGAWEIALGPAGSPSAAT